MLVFATGDAEIAGWRYGRFVGNPVSNNDSPMSQKNQIAAKGERADEVLRWMADEIESQQSSIEAFNLEYTTNGQTNE